MHRRLIDEIRPHTRWYLLSVGAGAAGGALAIVQAYLVSRLVGSALGVPLHQDLAWLSFGVLAIFLGRAGLAWASETASGRLAAVIQHRLRSKLLDRIFAAGPLALRQEESGEIVHTLNEGISALEPYYAQYVLQIALAVLLPLAILGVVLPLDPLSGIILLLTGPLIPFFMWLVGSSGQALTSRQYQALSRMSGYFMDVLQGLPTLKMLGRSAAQIEILRRTGERFRQMTMEVLRVTFLSALALEWLSTLSTAVVAVQIGLRLLNGQMEFVPAFFILLLAPEYYLPLRLLGQRFHAGMGGAAAAERIFELEKNLNATSTRSTGQSQEERVKARFVNSPTPQRGDAIALEGVTFTYPDGRTALQDVNLEIPGGQVTALVGPSGSGKSTLAALLLGFALPTQGRILVNGQEVTRDDKMPRAAWVPQQPFLWNDTAAANIALGRPDASLENIRHAAELAGADEFIQALPDGYQTQIGEGGASLSSGQAQRLALARAFLMDAPLLVLDEPSAFLDTASEAELTNALQRLAVGRTVVIIAHRLATIQFAQQVVVVEEGRVRVEGGKLPTPMPIPKAKEVTYPPALSLRGRELPIPGNQSSETEYRNSEPGSVPPTARQALDYLLGLLRPHTKRVLLSVGLGFFASASGAGLLGTAAYLIARASQAPSIADLQVAIVGVRFFGLGRGLFRYLERLASHQVTFSLLAELRVRFYAALEPRVPDVLVYRRSGDLLQRAIGDIQTLENFFVRVVAPPLTAALTILAGAAFLGQLDIRLGVSLVILALVGGGILPALGWFWNWQRGPLWVQQRSELHAHLVGCIQGLGELLVFGPDDTVARAKSASRHLSQTQARQAAQTALFNSLGGLAAHLSMWTALMIALQAAGAGTLAPVFVGMVLLIAWSSFETVQTLPSAAQHLAVDLAAGQRLLEMVGSAGAIHESPLPLTHGSRLPLNLESPLQVKGLSFRYPTRHTPSLGMEERQVASEYLPATQKTLQDINLRVEPGQHVAIVGPSGAGKTTLLHLVLRLWVPEAGVISLGGRDIQHVDPQLLRQTLAIAPAKAYLFNATLADNIRVSVPAANQAEVEAAAELAGIHAWIAGLPSGYQTWAGEGGLRLSAGERQRISLARALLRRSPLLLLDEPTAGLDPRQALTIWQMLDDLRRTPSTAGPPTAILTVTHSLAGLETVDEIIYLENGKILERGSYSGLMASQGRFAQLFASDYPTKVPA